MGAGRPKATAGLKKNGRWRSKSTFRYQPEPVNGQVALTGGTSPIVTGRGEAFFGNLSILLAPCLGQKQAPIPRVGPAEQA